MSTLQPKFEAEHARLVQQARTIEDKKKYAPVNCYRSNRNTCCSLVEAVSMCLDPMCLGHSTTLQQEFVTCRQLMDFRDRLEEITVDEMLEKYPVLAQEIKDEIEAGIWYPTDAGFKIPEKALAK